MGIINVMIILFIFNIIITYNDVTLKISELILTITFTSP
jgi:hypothetical protein